jgi:hypothetical protein
MKRRTREPDPGKKLAHRLTRGGTPQNSRVAGVRFVTGHRKRAGRKKGIPNRMTRDLREAIIEAAIASGYDTKGKGGLQGYLKKMADNDMRTFGVMLRSLMPRHIEANIRHDKPYLTEAEVLAELKVRGLPPETLFQLRFHEVPAEDVDLYGGEDGEVIDLQSLKPTTGETE